MTHDLITSVYTFADFCNNQEVSSDLDVVGLDWKKPPSLVKVCFWVVNPLRFYFVPLVLV